MSADVEELLDRLAGSWDAAASPITLDEIVAGTSDVIAIGDGADHGRGRSRWWLIAACALLLIGSVVALTVIDRNGADAPAVDLVTTTWPSVPSTTAPKPSTTPPTTSPKTVWSDAVRESSDVVRRMDVVEENGYPTTQSAWQDPIDAPADWIDVERVVYEPGTGCNNDGSTTSQPHWTIELAAKPPLATDLEPGMLIAYGLVLETTGDGVADYVVGIDNDAPVRGDLHVWVTDLATGETDEEDGPPYGFPVEFKHPDEQQPNDAPGPPSMFFTFLGDSKPADLSPETVRFSAWTSATRGGEVLGYDYAPDTGWITPAPTLALLCPPPSVYTVDEQ